MSECLFRQPAIVGLLFLVRGGEEDYAGPKKYHILMVRSLTPPSEYVRVDLCEGSEASCRYHVATDYVRCG